MKLTVKRTDFNAKATIGELYIDGVFFCYTLEDVVRPIGFKVQNQTAIPTGTYEVIIDDSTRFKMPMPHILNVPGFEGIRIHWGNTDLQTDGCILVGHIKVNEDFIGVSKSAFNDLFSKLQKALKTNKVFIEVTGDKDASNS